MLLCGRDSFIANEKLLRLRGEVTLKDLEGGQLADYVGSWLTSPEVEETVVWSRDLFALSSTCEQLDSCQLVDVGRQGG